MLTPLKSEILKVDDLSHEARRFRTILWSFERNMDLLFKDTGLTAEVDHAALAEAFSRWRLAFDNSKYLASTDRRDFVIYAAGLMLKELIAASPLKAVEGKEQGLSVLPIEIDHRLKRWPEGYAYTSFCLSVAAAILKEMGDAEPVLAVKDRRSPLLGFLPGKCPGKPDDGRGIFRSRLWPGPQLGSARRAMAAPCCLALN